MLADEIDGGILALLVLLACGGVSLLALIGLVPAMKGNRTLTLVMISPALLAVVTITIWLGYGVFTDGLKDPDARLSDFFAPWLIFSGLPVITSGAALLVLWFRRRRLAAFQTTAPPETSF
jgi:hypothetical protein